jgi:hypothetical protein
MGLSRPTCCGETFDCFYRNFPDDKSLLRGRIKSCPEEVGDTGLFRLTLCYLLTASHPDHMVIKAQVEVEAVDAGKDAVKEMTGSPNQKPFRRKSGRPNRRCRRSGSPVFSSLRQLTMCDGTRRRYAAETWAAGNRCISARRDNRSIYLSIQQQPTKGADDGRKAF